MLRLSEDNVESALCRSDFYSFVQSFWSTIVPETPIWGWHIKYLCDLLQKQAGRVFRGEPKKGDVLLNISPGTSKSTVVSIMFPAWVWTRMPSARFIGGSYSHNIAVDLSRKCHDVITSEKYKRCFPEVQLTENQDTKTYFVNTKGGMRYSVGAGGSVTGMHAHFILIDDPINPEQAVSEVELETINRWIKSTLSSRKVDSRITLTVLVMQRLHQDDPSAEMMKRKDVIHVRLPAILDYEVYPPELADNYSSGLMDPIRLPKSVLDEKLRDMGQYGFAGQYGQCLVAGTLVSTARGLVPIESVTSEDYVFTRQGLKRVLWAGETKRVSNLVSVLFSNGSIITGTSNHPVWTNNRGWVPLDSLRGCDIVLVRPQQHRNGGQEWEGRQMRQQRLCTSRARNTSEPKVRDISRTGVRVGITCTETFGDTTRETFPLARSFTTLTMTGATTRLETLRAFPSRLTTSCTPLKDLIENFLIGFAHWRGRGIQQRKESGATGRMGERHSSSSGRVSGRGGVLVSCVGQGSGRGSETRSRCTVPGSARKSAGSGNTESGVPFVTSDLSPQTIEYHVAQSRVEMGGGGLVSVPVYDLTVAGSPEFYANGILVHNSPTPPGGGMFKVAKIQERETPPLEMVVRYWDKAGTENKGTRLRGKAGGTKAAWTVGVKMGRDYEGGLHVLDVQRFRLDTYKREKMICEVARVDGRSVIVGLEQEPGSGGMESAENTVKRLLGYRVRIIAPRGDKILRADPYSVQVNAGNVSMPDMTKDWVKAYLEELQFFPFSTYLDQVDASSGAFSLLARGKKRVGGIKRGKSSKFRSRIFRLGMD